MFSRCYCSILRMACRGSDEREKGDEKIMKLSQKNQKIAVRFAVGLVFILAAVIFWHAQTTVERLAVGLVGVIAIFCLWLAEVATKEKKETRK